MKTLSLICAIVLNGLLVTAQFDFDSYTRLPNLAPSSPDAASIERFGNIPVDYSTGIPQISIPLLTMKCGDINWPISISYHSGGIKVDEISSRVGLGWALQGPGVISRAVLGRPDEESNSEQDFSSVTSANYDYLFLVKNGQADTELDVFNYNFNGKSGKFFIKQNGEIFQQPYTKMKITRNSPNSFTIIDENAIIYTFDKCETSYVESSPIQIYNSSWYLSKVKTADTKQEIGFVYQAAGTSKRSSFNFSQPMGMGIIQSPGSGPCGYVLNQETYSSFIEMSKTDITTNTLKLTQINFPNGSISLTYSNDRQDIDGTDKGRLAELTIHHQPSNQVLKKFTFGHSYFYHKPTGFSANVRQYRLRLDNVTETSDGLSKPYSFEYNQTNMVPRENFGQDKWGFNNGNHSNQSLLQSETVSYLNAQTYYMGNANRSIDTSKMKACMLTTIHWPTGGENGICLRASRISVKLQCSYRWCCTGACYG